MAGAVDFFVSYTSADRPWAEWMAWELETAGYSTRIQAWDMQPGSNFVLEMDEATQVARRTVAVLSPAFLESRYARAEWAAAFAEDPTGEQRKLVPVRVRDCDPRGLLKSIVYVNVVGLSEEASRTALLEGVKAGRGKPDEAPGFPGRVASARAGERVRRPEDGAAIFNVPVMTRTFVGRERTLQQLGTGLSGEGVIAVTQVDAIHGLGGVGKTQLAARYARVHRGDYDVIWWLRAEQPATLRADLAALAVALGLVDVDVEEPEAVGAAQGWLARTPRWLLVFDNVPAPATIVELVPEGEGGHVLITSRAHADWRSFGARPIALDVWERSESHAFLRGRTGEQDTMVLDEVADALGDLPLALEQAAAYANAKAITVAGYLQRLRARGGELFAAGQPLGYEHTVATAWSLAFSELCEQPVAAELAFVCAHLAPERIPRELLDALAEVSEDSTVTAGSVDEAIELLLRYGLLSATAHSTVAMHRLVQDVARAAADPSARMKAASRAIGLLDAVMPARPWEHEEWPRCARLVAHAITASRHAQDYGAAGELTANLLQSVGIYEQVRGNFRSAKELAERAVAVSEATRGPEHPDVARSLGNLGLALEELGDLEGARHVQQRSLTMLEAAHGLQHVDVGRTLGNLGRVLAELGDVPHALRFQQRALEVFEAVLGSEHPDVAINLGNRGIILMRLGQLDDARATLERALEIFEKTCGRDHPEVARVLTNLGSVLLLLGEVESARDAQQRALAIFESAFGPEHQDIPAVLTNLANALQELGELRLALDVQERAVAMAEAIYGPDHPEVAMPLSGLGLSLLRLGQVEAARAAHQRALTIFEVAYGSEHPETDRTRCNLEIVLQQLKDEA